MNQTSKTIGKLLKFSGPFRITILLSAVFSAFSAVINLKAYLCVYGVAKVLIQSSGNFGALDLAAMKALGMQAVWYVCMGFGTYGMALLCSHISAYNTVARIRMQLIRHLGTLPLGYHILHPSGKQRKIIEKNTDNLEILIAHNIPDYVQSLVLPIAFLVFMFRYDWRLSLICLVPILIGFILLFSMLKGESSGFIEQVQKSGEDISNAATEYVRGIAVVKTFGQTASSFRRYQRAVKEYADFMTKYAFSMENAFSLYTTIVNAVFLFLIPGGIVLYNLGGGAEKTIMTFAFFAVLIPLVASIRRLVHVYRGNVGREAPCGNKKAAGSSKRGDLPEPCVIPIRSRREGAGRCVSNYPPRYCNCIGGRIRRRKEHGRQPHRSILGCERRLRHRGRRRCPGAGLR